MIITKEAFNRWMQEVLRLRYIDMDGAHGAQCWDLFAHFCDWFGIQRVNTYGGRWSGWAGALVDQYAANGASLNFDLVRPDQPAQLADTAVWGDSYDYYPKTHVATVVADAGGLLLCLSQNSSPPLPDNPYPGKSSGPTILQHLPKRGLIGYLRPRISSGLAPAGTTTAPTEEDTLSTADVERIINEVSGNDEKKHVVTRGHVTRQCDWAVLRIQSQIEAHHDLSRRYLKDVIENAFKAVPGVDMPSVLAAIAAIPAPDAGRIESAVKDAMTAALENTTLELNFTAKEPADD